jgi:hypothetical protein
LLPVLVRRSVRAFERAERIIDRLACDLEGGARAIAKVGTAREIVEHVG